MRQLHKGGAEPSEHGSKKTKQEKGIQAKQNESGSTVTTALLSGLKRSRKSPPSWGQRGLHNRPRTAVWGRGGTTPTGLMMQLDSPPWFDVVPGGQLL